MKQQALMRFDPRDCTVGPRPSDANQWRKHHGQEAWFWNPWTGDVREGIAVGRDPFGLDIVAPGDTEEPKRYTEEEASHIEGCEKPIIGQEAICPDGIGRVADFGDGVANSHWIRVDTYLRNRGCHWDHTDVELIPIHR